MITVNSSSNIVIPTGDDTYEYNLQTETTGTITMVYTPPSSGTSNTILVLTWPAYAALRNTAPAIGINHIADIKLLVLLALLIIARYFSSGVLSGAPATVLVEETPAAPTAEPVGETGETPEAVSAAEPVGTPSPTPEPTADPTAEPTSTPKPTPGFTVATGNEAEEYESDFEPLPVVEDYVVDLEGDGLSEAYG